jgi:hypothetical protein
VPKTQTLLRRVIARVLLGKIHSNTSLFGQRNFEKKALNCENNSGLLSLYLVPRVGIEPTLLSERDFESRASTNSAISAKTPLLLSLRIDANAGFCLACQCQRVTSKRKAQLRLVCALGLKN